MRTNLIPEVVIQQDGVDKVSNPKNINFVGSTVAVTEDPAGDGKITFSFPEADNKRLILPYDADNSSSQSAVFGATYVNLRVFACPCELKPLTVDGINAYVTANFTAGDLLAIGVYDYLGALIAETGWMAIPTTASPKFGVVLASAISRRQTGFVAFSFIKASTTGRLLSVVMSQARVRFANFMAFPITAATNASPIVITAAGHGFANGTSVKVGGCLGNTAANGIWTVANQAANTFELAGSVGNGTYTSLSGTVFNNTLYGAMKVYIGIAANDATSGAAGAAAMPSSLGNLVPAADVINFPMAEVVE